MLASKILGQLSLMQSVVVNLPDEDSIFSFICRGLVDIPGVVEVKHFKVPDETVDDAIIKFSLLIEQSNFGEIQLTVNDFEAYKPYQEYLENFIFMVKIILEERNQRHQNLLHQALLEERVKERTEQLSNEIKVRKETEDRLLIALTKYKTLFNTIPIGVTVSDAAGKILESNKFAEKLLGLTQEVHTQRNIDSSDWHIIRTDGSIMPAEEFASVRALKEENLIENVEMGIVKSDGEITWMSVTADLLSLEGYGVVVAYSDISERVQAEEKLKRLLREKEILLAEVHHRVKNNLQVVTSMLNLQTEGIQDENILKMLEDSRNRIQSMTLVHEQLYRAKEYASIDFETYVDQLASTLFSMYQVDNETIQFEVKAQNVSLDLDRAIPCGLLLNELITNSLKYAFPDGRKGNVWVKMKAEDGKIVLQVGDDGIGLPTNYDLQSANTLGIQLINLLVTHDLHGKLAHNSNAGTEFQIEFPLK